MDKFDKSKAPYYVRNLDSDYTELLFLPGQHIQNAEMNEIQDNSKKFIKSIGDCFLSDGDIRSGVQIIINDRNITVTSGKLYLEGIVRNFKQQTLEIIGKGTELIGVKLKQEVVSYLEDKDLLSPAAGFKNHKLRGADRLKETVVLTINDEKATTLFIIQDGELLKEKKQEDDSFIKQLNDTLAERTYDESGHYTVYGLELSQKNQFDTDKLYLSLAAGKAYVEGYAVKKTTATTIPIDRSVSTRSIIAEPKIYKSNVKRYKLNNAPVSEIKRVMGLISIETKLTRQGSVNGIDPIPAEFTPVVDVVEITQEGTTYEKNVDYVLESDSIRWIAGGKQPELGATYEIIFHYNKRLIAESEYNLIGNNEGYFLELTNEETVIVDNSQIQIDYDFYLHYIASIAIDKDGKIHSILGQPDSYDNIAPPNITDDSVLLLGYIKVAPLNDNLVVYNSKNRRSEMAKIQRMYERLEEAELNQAISDLDREAIDLEREVKEGEQATKLKGIITDAFVGWSKADVNHPEFSAAIDPINRILTSGYDQTIHRLTLDTEKTMRATVYDNIVTAKAIEILKESQPYATESHLINPYTVYPETPYIKIIPSSDVWTDTENIIIQKDGGTIIKTTTIGSSHSDIEETESKDVLETAIEFMRPIDIKFTGRKFQPFQTGIRVLFNDIEVSVVPDGEVYNDLNGALRADGNGEVKGTFKIPQKQRCGTISVKIYCDDYPTLIGSAPFTAEGILTTTTTTITKTKIETRRIDPVAQTIEFNEDQMLNGIGLFFSVVEDGHPIIVQVREAVNGYPSDVVLAETIIESEDIQVSSDSSVETIVRFENPIYCRANTQYSFTTLTNSDKSSMFVQDLGGINLLSKQIVARNPYTNGVMFSSSNALTWTPHQTKNIKFNLYTNTYEEQSEILFYPVIGVDYDAIGVYANTFVPLGCSLNWEYSSDGEKTWLPIALNRYQELTNKIDNLIIRAKITTKGNVSPYVVLDSLLLVGSKNKDKSIYISKNVNTDIEFDTVRVVVDVDTPLGTGVVFYYATDINGKDWKPLAQEGEGKVKVDKGYTEYNYVATEPNKVKNFRVKAVLTTNNSTIKPRVKALKCIMK